MKNLFFATKALCLTLVIQVSCASNLAENDHQIFSPRDGFNEYWYQGKAEITSYNLQQARYGELREGKAVLVFVTEDFSSNKQVKLDRPSQAVNDALKVMKLNLVKKFNTGIYPYSMMQSVFTPVDLQRSPHSLKVTTSSQEWCGHTFTQLNLSNSGYAVQSFSYFESEGDSKKKLDKVLLEDEIWNRIRIAPESLPKGEITIIPGTMAQRLRHSTLDKVKATASLQEHSVSEMVYELRYPGDQRVLRIFYNKDFPFAINGWEETYKDGFGPNAKMLTTTAVSDNTILSDYWTKNSNADTYLRDELNLDF